MKKVIKHYALRVQKKIVTRTFPADNRVLAFTEDEDGLDFAPLYGHHKTTYAI